MLVAPSVRKSSPLLPDSAHSPLARRQSRSAAPPLRPAGAVPPRASEFQCPPSQTIAESREFRQVLECGSRLPLWIIGTSVRVASLARTLANSLGSVFSRPQRPAAPQPDP